MLHPALLRLRLVALACMVLVGGFALGRTDAAEPAAKWVGQDGKDFVGAEPGPGPNGYQDIHVVLLGLPPGRNLAEVVFKGHGHGEWNNVVKNKAAVHVVRSAKPGTFDLYLEPYERETGRQFELKWKLDNGQAGGLYFAGGKADPNLRAGGLGIEAKWVNPTASAATAQDRTGPGVGVGPDGLEDAHIAISKLAPKAEIKEVAVKLANGPTWRSGLNPQGGLNAEFVRHRDDKRSCLLIGIQRDDEMILNPVGSEAGPLQEGDHLILLSRVFLNKTQPLPTVPEIMPEASKD